MNTMRVSSWAGRGRSTPSAWESEPADNSVIPVAQQQRLIGLTGGVGMGKTMISNYLHQAYHLPILDADIYAREAVEPGSAVLADIIDRYGVSIQLPDGHLDRRRLGEIIFNSLPERRWLEQQIHPFVRDRLTAHLIAEATQPIVVLVIPLLFEAQMTDLVTEVWVVHSNRDLQQQRLMERDRIPAPQVEARINSQMAIEQKIQQADVVLDNSSTPEHLFQQIDRALKEPHGHSPARFGFA